MESKSCRNCESRHSEFIRKDMCMLSGQSCLTERQHPLKCGTHYENWQRREPGFFGKIIRMFFMVSDK